MNGQVVEIARTKNLYKSNLFRLQLEAFAVVPSDVLSRATRGKPAPRVAQQNGPEVSSRVIFRNLPAASRLRKAASKFKVQSS